MEFEGEGVSKRGDGSPDRGAVSRRGWVSNGGLGGFLGIGLRGGKVSRIRLVDFQGGGYPVGGSPGGEGVVNRGAGGLQKG